MIFSYVFLRKRQFLLELCILCIFDSTILVTPKRDDKSLSTYTCFTFQKFHVFSDFLFVIFVCFFNLMNDFFKYYMLFKNFIWNQWTNK